MITRHATFNNGEMGSVKFSHYRIRNRHKKTWVSVDGENWTDTYLTPIDSTELSGVSIMFHGGILNGQTRVM